MTKLSNQISNNIESFLQPSGFTQINASFSVFSPQNIKQTQPDSLVRLFQLYLYYGSAWKYIKSQISSGIKDPKNYIYNAIRRSAKELAKYETNILSKRRRLINRETLLSMLEIVNQVQKEIMSRHLTLNQDCQLFRFKKALLRFSLWENSLSQDEIVELIVTMKEINLKLRCLSIFKAKSRKNWKISKKAMMLISSFDRVIVEPQFGFELSHGQCREAQGEESIEKTTQKKEEFTLSSSPQQMETIFWLETRRASSKYKSLEDEVDQILKVEWSDLSPPLDFFEHYC